MYMTYTYLSALLEAGRHGPAELVRAMGGQVLPEHEAFFEQVRAGTRVINTGVDEGVALVGVLWRTLFHTQAMGIVLAPTLRQRQLLMADLDALVFSSPPLREIASRKLWHKLVLGGQPDWCIRALNPHPANLLGHSRDRLTVLTLERLTDDPTLFESTRALTSGPDHMLIRVW